MNKQFFRSAISLGMLVLGGCGVNTGLTVVPDDCAFFNRAEARAWYATILSEQSDGSTKLEATAVIVQQCLGDHCDGTSGGVCAVSCTACADALATVAYE